MEMNYVVRQRTLWSITNELSDEFEYIEGNVDICTFKWTVCIQDNGYRYILRFGKDIEISKERVKELFEKERMKHNGSDSEIVQ